MLIQIRLGGTRLVKLLVVDCEVFAISPKYYTMIARATCCIETPAKKSSSIRWITSRARRAAFASFIEVTPILLARGCTLLGDPEYVLPAFHSQPSFVGTKIPLAQSPKEHPASRFTSFVLERGSIIERMGFSLFSGANPD
jgi:hypothetical protein